MLWKGRGATWPRLDVFNFCSSNSPILCSVWLHSFIVQIKINFQEAEWCLDRYRQIIPPLSLQHGDMDQKERDIIMREFRSGSSRVLITTDLLVSPETPVGVFASCVNYFAEICVDEWAVHVPLFRLVVLMYSRFPWLSTTTFRQTERTTSIGKRIAINVLGL